VFYGGAVTGQLDIIKAQICPPNNSPPVRVLWRVPRPKCGSRGLWHMRIDEVTGDVFLIGANRFGRVRLYKIASDGSSVSELPMFSLVGDFLHSMVAIDGQIWTLAPGKLRCHKITRKSGGAPAIETFVVDVPSNHGQLMFLDLDTLVLFGCSDGIYLFHLHSPGQERDSSAEGASGGPPGRLERIAPLPFDPPHTLVAQFPANSRMFVAKVLGAKRLLVIS
jgi:hypothetical protein